MPLPVLASLTKGVQFQPFLFVTKRTKIREPMGRSRLLTMKSSRSRKPVPSPRGWMPERTLKPRAQGRERRNMATQLMAHAFFRVHLKASMQQEMMFSKTARTVDMAAKVMKTKNRVPHSRPMGMLLNTLGKVTNRRLGPAPTSTPCVKQAGKMIRPATMATKVSRMVTVTDSPMRARSLLM